MRFLQHIVLVFKLNLEFLTRDARCFDLIPEFIVDGVKLFLILDKGGLDHVLEVLDFILHLDFALLEPLLGLDLSLLHLFHLGNHRCLLLLAFLLDPLGLQLAGCTLLLRRSEGSGQVRDGLLRGSGLWRQRLQLGVEVRVVH